MIIQILSADWFQLIVIPIILSFLGGGFTALASQETSPSLEHWLVGIELCLEGWAINLGLAANKARTTLALLSPTEAAATFQKSIGIFAAVTLAQFILLVAVAYIVRFGRGSSRLRFALSNFLGAVAIALAFFGWR
jgi:hypothetical protein